MLIQLIFSIQKLYDGNKIFHNLGSCGSYYDSLWMELNWWLICAGTTHIRIVSEFYMQQELGSTCYLFVRSSFGFDNWSWHSSLDIFLVGGPLRNFLAVVLLILHFSCCWSYSFWLLFCMQKHEGYPWGSMVDFACDANGFPILAVSSLAVHTKVLT